MSFKILFFSLSVHNNKSFASKIFSMIKYIVYLVSIKIDGIPFTYNIICPREVIYKRSFRNQKVIRLWRTFASKMRISQIRGHFYRNLSFFCVTMSHCLYVYISLYYAFANLPKTRNIFALHLDRKKRVALVPKALTVWNS